MDLGPFRALVVDLNFDAHGVPATVTRPAPNDTPITTRVLWVTADTELVPSGGEFQRRDPIRVAALRRDQVPTVPEGTEIVAPEQSGGPDVTWRVEATLRVEAGLTRVIVIEEP